MSQASEPARLLWHKPDGSIASLPLLGEVITVGRDETANLCIDEPLVSRLHARIERRADAYVVMDLGSTNLTRVNGEVVGQRELRDGDELRFGRARCTFRAPGTDDSTNPG